MASGRSLVEDDGRLAEDLGNGSEAASVLRALATTSEVLAEDTQRLDPSISLVSSASHSLARCEFNGEVRSLVSLVLGHRVLPLQKMGDGVAGKNSGRLGDFFVADTWR
ncbi:hypothetical protein Dimus_035843 [Dionaea muscipula]